MGATSFHPFFYVFMKNWKDNVYFVIVEPRESGNIGASARAIKNMGFKNLVLVKPPAVITDEAGRLARNALDVLGSAKTFDNLADAIKDKSVVAGTARRTGKRRGLIVPVKAGAKRLAGSARNNKVAILFGREDRGLYNDEVEECGLILNIPANKEQPSLNLAQAVLIVAYELSGAGFESSDSKKFQKLVKHEEIMLLYERMAGILKILEYTPQGDRNLEKMIMQNLKHFIGRAGLTDWELNMLHGIITRIHQKVKV